MASEDALNYDELIILDSERLAEQGMASAYEEISDELKKRGILLSPIEELIDDDKGTYQVLYKDKIYSIYGDMNDKDGWAKATVALFDIINSQLINAPFLLYAVNGGNDLGGMILTKSQYDKSCKAIDRKVDWPYTDRRIG